MQSILVSLTLLMLLATVLPIFNISHWTVRGFDFPRLQISVALALLLVAHLCLLDIHALSAKVLIAVTVLCFIWQARWILPYTFLWPREVKACIDNETDNQLCILTSNVLKSNRNSDALIELVKRYQPDVLVTLESDQWWEDRLRCLETEMPYSIKCPLDNLYGMHVYSRLPLREHEVCFLVEKDVPSMHTQIELRTKDTVRAHFLHPAPPSPTENPESAQRDAELVMVARSIGDSDQPVIVAGDLNDVAWSATTRLFRKISGLLDPRVGRGMFNTFHAGYPFVRWPLDHLFHSHHFTLHELRRLPSIGSDHFPLLARLSFMPTGSAQQNGLEVLSTDRERINDICDKQGVSKDDVPKPD